MKKDNNKLDIINLFHELEKTDVFEYFASQGDLADFIAQIWPVESMSSTDERFQNLYDDIYHHCVNNTDYTMTHVFVSLLHIEQDIDKFNRFLEYLSNARYYENSKVQEKYISQFNIILLKYNFKYALLKYDKDGFGLYILKENTSSIYDCNIKLNTIPFFVDIYPTGRADKKTNHEKPTVFPSFVLVYNDWNDFSVHTEFDLFFYENVKECTYIGKTKILYETELDLKHGDHYYIKDYIPDNFTKLSSEFCSLGQDEQFYKNLLKVCGDVDTCKIVLWALKDCAIFPSLAEKFDNHKQWHSLVRMDSAERMLREAVYIIEGTDIRSHYQFKYSFIPKYSTEKINISFDFTKEGYFDRRIFGFIGKNGVGKTQLITSLPLQLAAKNKNYFNGEVPIFSKVIAVSNSYYDNFEIPDASADFNYVYCGLSQQPRGKDKTVMTLDEMRGRIIESGREIVKRERIDTLLAILQIVFTEGQLDNIITFDKDNKRIFDAKEISRLCNELSSGENSMLYIFFVLLANIRYDSLLLFDEPETHLHPNAITELMTAIYKLLDQFDSYAIITTHSPLIIREMKSDSVYIMEKDDDTCIVRKIGVESLGANPSTLIDEIFNNKGIQKHYKKAIMDMKDDGKSYKEIVDAIQTDDIPLGLGLSFYIRNLFESEEQ